MVNARLKMALKRGVKTGEFVQRKGQGASGSFRVADRAKAKHAAGGGKKKRARKPKSAGGSPAKKARKSPKKKAAKKATAAAAGDAGKIALGMSERIFRSLTFV